MARCEDYPCCGHEAGCCPDFDESGRQLNMRCVCGAIVPLNSRSSLCPTCLSEGMDDDEPIYDDDDPNGYPDDDEPFNDTPLDEDYGGE